jgi:hypothetical protein
LVYCYSTSKENTMKILIAAVAACITISAKAGFWNGNTLYSHLTSSNGSEKLAGLGYLMGSADVADGLFVCAPGQVTVGQMVDIVVADLRASPENRHQSADILVVKALRKVWPCQSQPKSRL